MRPEEDSGLLAGGHDEFFALDPGLQGHPGRSSGPGPEGMPSCNGSKPVGLGPSRKCSETSGPVKPSRQGASFFGAGKGLADGESLRSSSPGATRQTAYPDRLANRR